MFCRLPLLFSFLLVSISSVFSQPKMLWTTTKTNPDSTIQLSDAARDYSGNIYTVTFGGSSYGITLSKYSNVGTLIRETPLSNQITYKYWLAADKSGNAYVVTNDDQKKLTLTKYSPTGDSLWAKKLILSLPQENYREGNTLIDIDGDGNVCIATSHEQLNGEGNFQAYLMMLSYSPNGDRRWMDTTISGLSAAPAEFGDIGIGQMKIDQLNNIYVSVSYKSRFDTTVYIAGSKLLKYAPAAGGVMNPPQWITNFSLKTISVEAAAMDIDAAGNIFMGYSHFISFDVGGRVRKYNSQGALQWERMINSSGAKIAADNNGGVYVGAGKTISASSVIARVFRFNGAESTYVGNFGSGNYSSIYNLSVDQGGYLAVSGIAKPQVFSTEGSYYFFEFTPSGAWNGYAMYASPGVSQEYPSHLFKGNGSYIALGVSGYAKSKAVVWISKIQVAPTTPTDPGGNGGGQGLQTPYVSVASGTTADLRSVYFTNQKNGFIVGDSSTILRTSNSGASWTKVASPVVSDFQKVKFYNADSGFIIGQGYILKTKDGGTTWNVVDDNVGVQTLYGIDWDTLGNMVAVGTSGTIHVSHNWGNSWVSNNFNTNASLKDVSFYSYNDPGVEFIAVGDLGIVLEGVSKGAAWTELVSPSIIGQNIKSLLKLGSVVYLCGDAIKAYHRSFNKSYVELVSIPPIQLSSMNNTNKMDNYIAVGNDGSFVVYIRNKGDVLDRYLTYNMGSKKLYSVFLSGVVMTGVGEGGAIVQIRKDGRTIVSPQINYSETIPFTLEEAISPPWGSGEILKTTNGGTTWVMADTGGQNGLWQFDAHANWFVRKDGKTFRYSDDKGNSWHSVLLPDTAKRIRQIGLSEDHTFFVYTNNVDWTNRTLYQTKNAGVEWDTIALPIVNYEYGDFQEFISTNQEVIWVVYTNGIDRYIEVYNSENNGKDWIRSKFSLDDGYSMIFYAFDNNNAVLFNNNSFHPREYRTENGGTSWEKRTVDPSQYTMSKARHSTILTSIIAEQISYSTDQGITWEVDPTPPIFFKDYQYSQPLRYNDSLYLVSSDEKNNIYIHSPRKEYDNVNTLPARFKRYSLHRMLANGTMSDTITIADSLGGMAVKNIVVDIDSLSLSHSTKNILMTLAHNGIIDTLFYQHEGTAIIDCRFSDNAPFVLGDRKSANFSLNYNPFSPLKKFNSSSVKGKWILSIHSSNLQQNATLKGWGIRINMDQVTRVERNGTIPSSFALSQNYPNPFNPTTMINYQLPMNSKVSLKIYDILGREVATLVNEIVNAGTYSTPFNSTRLASGVYFYRIEATPTDGSRNRFVDVKKMMYLK